MASIYDITGDNFFTPLASKNRKIYMESILYLHGLINELFEAGENDKNKIIDALTYHLNDLVSIKLYQENSDEEIENATDNASKARFIINTLENYGWLIEETIGNGKRAMDFTSHSYNFIALIEELIKNRKPSYTGYVRVLKDVVFKFDYSRIDNLEIVDKQLNDFDDEMVKEQNIEVVSLRGLRSSIQRYYRNITKNKNSMDLEALLDEFTGEYKDVFFDSSYLRLKIVDNVDTEIPKIEEKLEEVFDDFLGMEKLIKARIDKDYKDYDAAYKFVNETQKRILSNVKTIPSLIKMIDTKNNKYVTRTVSVIIHLISRGEDIEGILNRLISYVKDNDITDQYLSLFEMNHYSFDLLSKPRKISPKPIPEVLPLNIDISDEIKQKALEVLQEDKKYNIYAVNKFVEEFLKGEKEKRISTLDLNSKYEFIMLICIIMHSKLPNALFELKLLDERVNKNGISFNDFIIREKGGIYND